MLNVTMKYTEIQTDLYFFRSKKLFNIETVLYNRFMDMSSNILKQRVLKDVKTFSSKIKWHDLGVELLQHNAIKQGEFA